MQGYHKLQDQYLFPPHPLHPPSGPIAQPAQTNELPTYAAANWSSSQHVSATRSSSSSSSKPDTPETTVTPDASPPSKGKGKGTIRKGLKPLPKRKVLPNACEPCRKRKSKCDGQKPACHSCVNIHKTECHYDLDMDMRRKGALRRKIRNFEAERGRYDIVVDALCGTWGEEERLAIVDMLRNKVTIDIVAARVLKHYVGELPKFTFNPRPEPGPGPRPQLLLEWGPPQVYEPNGLPRPGTAFEPQFSPMTGMEVEQVQMQMQTFGGSPHMLVVAQHPQMQAMEQHAQLEAVDQHPHMQAIRLYSHIQAVKYHSSIHAMHQQEHMRSLNEQSQVPATEQHAHLQHLHQQTQMQTMNEQSEVQTWSEQSEMQAMNRQPQVQAWDGAISAQMDAALFSPRVQAQAPSNEGILDVRPITLIDYSGQEMGEQSTNGVLAGGMAMLNMGQSGSMGIPNDNEGDAGFVDPRVLFSGQHESSRESKL